MDKLHLAKGESVVQDWLKELTFKQQTVLFSAIRGCDGVASKVDPSKPFVKFLRATILKSAVPNDPKGFFKLESPDKQIINTFMKHLHKYPLHWVTHFMHAAEIIGYFHPNNKVAIDWKNIYESICHALHVNPETKKENLYRLRDGVRSE